MFALLIFIIVNIVFILFYLQVEPVFLPACLNKAIQITSVSSISATVLQYFGATHSTIWQENIQVSISSHTPMTVIPKNTRTDKYYITI